MTEFEIIKKFFSTQQQPSENVFVGIGDDAAVISIPHGKQLVITTDTLVNGIHFLESTSAYDIAYKSLAVNLSDLAAMGATPHWVTLTITLPTAEEAWLTDFSKGFFALANQFDVKLIGGDTTCGPLSITIQAMGLVSMPKVLLRKTAEVNDLILVSNTLGDAGVALQILQNNLAVAKNHQDYFISKLERPLPQIALGVALANFANSAIDISDGLLADLQHLLTASEVGATINVANLPLSDAMQACIAKEKAYHYALSSGDDYQLCFTLSEEQAEKNQALLHEYHCTCIGKINSSQTLTLLLDGKPFTTDKKGYQHF